MIRMWFSGSVVTNVSKGKATTWSMGRLSNQSQLQAWTLSHEGYGRAGPPAFTLLHELAEFAASPGAVSKKIFIESEMRNLSTTTMPRHRTAGPCVGAIASAPRWSTGPPWSACSNRWPCLNSRPRCGVVLAPGSALAARSGRCVRSAIASPPADLPILNPCSHAQVPVSLSGQIQGSLMYFVPSWRPTISLKSR